MTDTREATPRPAMEARERLGPDEIAELRRVSKAILSELSDRSLLNGIGQDLHEEIGLSLARCALASRALPAAPDVVEEKRVKVPGGQTPLDDNLSHRYLAVLDEGSKARDSGEGSPYHGHSLEHCLHATGWVSRDLRLALNKAREECKTACDQARRQAYAECIAALKKEREAFLSEEYAYPQPIGSLSERFACDECIKAIEALAEANS